MTLIVKNPTTAQMLNEARVIAINARSQTPKVGVSTEALQLNFVHKKTVEKLKELWGTTSGFVQRLFNNVPTVLAPSLDFARVIRVAENNVYTNDKDIKVAVPEGLTTNYVAYLDVLEQMVDASIDFYDNTLLPFKGWVGECLNDPTKLESIRGHNGVKVLDPEVIIKARGKLIKGSATEVKYGQAFRRNGDWEEIEKRVNRILERMAGAHSPTIVNDAVMRLDSSIGALIDAMVDPQKTYNASPKNVEALALLCYNLAKMIEFYGLTCYSVQSTATALNVAAEKYLKARG